MFLIFLWMMVYDGKIYHKVMRMWLCIHIFHEKECQIMSELWNSMESIGSDEE